MHKILVIDDEQQILNHFRQLLPLLGCEPVTAATGEEGLQQALATDLKMIISDLCMPGDLVELELELVRELRRMRPHVPLVVISGYPSGEFLEECEALGVEDFLTKPFELSFISAIIQKHLGPSPGATR